MMKAETRLACRYALVVIAFGIGAVMLPRVVMAGEVRGTLQVRVEVVEACSAGLDSKGSTSGDCDTATFIEFAPLDQAGTEGDDGVALSQATDTDSQIITITY
jgi:hypothetical protein